MEKSEEILEKHIVLNDCIGYLGSDGRLYKAIIDALNEAINYTHSCTELKDKEVLNFSEWCEVNKYTKTKNGKYVDTQDLWFTEKALLKTYNLDL